MTLTYNHPTIVALLDKPSSESFGMTALIVQPACSEMYQTMGLASGNMIITSDHFAQFQGGHWLNVHSSLPNNLTNPVALWLGTNFYTKATELKAPTLPTIDENWYLPLKPNERRGRYTIKEPAEAYKILDDWVTETAREALARNSYDLAVLTRWTLPCSPLSKAALYFTTPDAQGKEVELKRQQLCTEHRFTSKKELIQEHEKVRSQLLERKE